MPLTTLKQPCWHLTTPEGSDYDCGADGSPHFATEADAQQEAVDRASGALGIHLPGLAPKPYPAPCVTVKCDGCGGEPESDDFTHLHFPDADYAHTNLDDFTILRGQAWCDNCRRAPHAFVADPAGGSDCERCAWPADEHEDEEVAALTAEERSNA